MADREEILLALIRIGLFVISNIGCVPYSVAYRIFLVGDLVRIFSFDLHDHNDVKKFKTRNNPK